MNSINKRDVGFSVEPIGFSVLLISVIQFRISFFLRSLFVFPVSLLHSCVVFLWFNSQVCFITIMGESLANIGIRAARLVSYSSSSSSLGKSGNIKDDLGQGGSRSDRTNGDQDGIILGVKDLGLNSRKMNTYGWKQIAMAKLIKKAKMFKCRQRKGNKIRVLDEKRKGKKPTKNEPVRCHRCQDSGHYAFRCTRNSSHDFLVKGTEGGTWNEIWYVNASYKWHVTGKEDLFVRFKDNLSDIFLHGVGDVKIYLNGRMREISCVSYVSKLNKNVYSVEQLMHQGYEVLKDGDECLVKDMFEGIHEFDEDVIQTTM